MHYRDQFLNDPRDKKYSFSAKNKSFLANPKIKIITIDEINTLVAFIGVSVE